MLISARSMHSYPAAPDIEVKSRGVHRIHSTRRPARIAVRNVRHSLLLTAAVHAGGQHRAAFSHDDDGRTPVKRQTLEGTHALTVRGQQGLDSTKRRSLRRLAAFFFFFLSFGLVSHPWASFLFPRRHDGLNLTIDSARPSERTARLHPTACVADDTWMEKKRDEAGGYWGPPGSILWSGSPHPPPPPPPTPKLRDA